MQVNSNNSNSASFGTLNWKSIQENMSRKPKEFDAIKKLEIQQKYNPVNVDVYSKANSNEATIELVVPHGTERFSKTFSTENPKTVVSTIGEYCKMANEKMVEVLSDAKLALKDIAH